MLASTVNIFEWICQRPIFDRLVQSGRNSNSRENFFSIAAAPLDGAVQLMSITQIEQRKLRTSHANASVRCVRLLAVVKSMLSIWT